MRPYVDQKLGLIARRLSSPPFRQSLDPALSLDTLKQLASQNKLKNVMLLPRQTHGWSIRMFIGGKSRYFGFFKYDYVTACRIADMLLFKLGSRRLKLARAPRPEEFNFSPENAARDYNNEPEVADIINQAEAHLSDIGALNNGAPQVDLYESVMRLEHKVNQLAAALNILMENQKSKQVVSNG